MVFMRPTNLVRFSLNFALNPVAAGVAGLSDDCWAVAGNENAPTARQSRLILITLICFSPYAFFFSHGRTIAKRATGSASFTVPPKATSMIAVALGIEIGGKEDVGEQPNSVENDP
jgi:hypothetical protein